MTAFTLGVEPLDMTVTLTRGADFVTTLRNPNASWPAGIAVELRFSEGTIWSASVVADEVRFAVDKADVDALIAGNARRARLFYIDGATELNWANGVVDVRA